MRVVCHKILFFTTLFLFQALHGAQEVVTSSTQIDFLETLTTSMVRSALPKAPRGGQQNLSQQETIRVSGATVAPRDAVYRRLDVNTLVVQKEIILTDVKLTGTIIVGSITSTGPIVGPSITINGPANVQNINVAGTTTSTNIVGSNLTITNNTNLNNANINNATINNLDVLNSLTVKDLYVTGSQHIVFQQIDNLSVLNTTTTKNLTVTNNATINTLDVTNLLASNVTITGPLSVTGPIFGNLVGNVTGNVAGNVLGNLTGNVVGNVSGASSLNVLKAGDTMTGQLRVSTGVVEPAVVITGQGAAASALQLINNPTSSPTDTVVGIDAQGNITRSTIPLGTIVGGTSGNVPNTLVLRDSSGNFVAGTITATGAFIGNLIGDVSGNVIGNLVGYHTGNMSGTVYGGLVGYHTGNVKGNLLGDVTGNLFGNVIGNVYGDVVGNVSGAASLNVLKSGDTMSGTLAIVPTTTAVAAVLTGFGITGAPALRLFNNPVSQASDVILTIDSSGNVTRSNTVIDLLTTGTSANIPNTLVLRDGSGSFAANVITADQVRIGSFGPNAQLVVGGLFSPVVTTGIGNGPSSLYVQGRYIFVTNQTDKNLQILDASDPFNPLGVGNCPLATPPIAVYAQGNYAQVITQGDPFTAPSLYCVNVSDPSNPTIMGSFPIGSTPITQGSAVYVQGSHVYVVNGQEDTLLVIDMSNPANLFLHGSISTPTTPYSVYVQDTEAFVVCDNGTLAMYDISVTSAPTFLGSLAGLGNLRSVYLKGRYAYVVSSGSLKVVDTSNPGSMSVIGSTLLDPGTCYVYVQGLVAYVANTSGTIQAVSISSPAVPTLIRTFGVSSSPVTIFPQGRYGYVVDPVDNSLVIVNLGGGYIQQFGTGGIESGTVAVRDNVAIGNNLDVKGGAVFGGSVAMEGDVGINGQVIANNTVTIANVSAPALQLRTNEAAAATDWLLAINGSGNVTQSTLPISLLATGTSANIPNTLVLRDASGNFAAGVITATGGFIGNLTGNVVGNVVGDVTGNVFGNVIGNLSGNVTGNVYGNVIGDLSGAASANVLKIGDTMTGQLRVSTGEVEPAVIITGQGSTAPALRLLQNPVASALDTILAINSSGDVTQSSTPISLLTDATSGNVPNTLVLRNNTGSFEANAAYLQGLDVVGTSTFHDYIYTPFENVAPTNILYVKKGKITAPNQFNSIKTAMDSITGNTPTNLFVVNVGPGVFIEDTITLKSYVALRGDSETTTIIEVDSPSKDIIIGADNTMMRNLVLRGATDAGKAAIVMDGGRLTMQMVTFGSSDILLKLRASVVPTVVSLVTFEFLSDAVFSTAFDIQGTSVLRPCGIACSNGVWLPTIALSPRPTPLTVINLTGPGAFLSGSVLSFGTPYIPAIAGTTGIQVSNGATMHLGSSLAQGFDVGFSVPVGGVTPLFNLLSVIGAHNNTDILVQNQLTQGSISGEFTRSKVMIDPSVTGLSVSMMEPTSGGITMVGPLSTGRTIALTTNISPALNDGTNLGVIHGGEIYTNPGSLVITVSAGQGYLMETSAGVDNLKSVEWATTQTVLIPNIDNYIYMDNNGVPKVALSDTSSLYTIPLGKARASLIPANGTLYVQEIKQDAAHTATKLADVLEISLGPIYVSGSIVTTNTTMGPLPSDKLDATSGQYTFGEHIFYPVGGTPLSWQAYLGAGTNEFLTTQTAVDYKQYDLAGTLTTIPTNYYAAHMLYVIGGFDPDCDRVAQVYALVYSQTVYPTLPAAEVGASPIPPISWTGNIVPIARIIVRNDPTTKIAEILDERPRPGFVSSSVAGVTVHGNLLGLLADDHPQYLLTNGGRTMTGSLNMGANQIINAGYINGVTIQAHAARHLPGSVLDDPLPMGVPVTIETTNQLSKSFGAVNNFAYSDHVHAHGDQPGGGLHALVTTVTAGFISNTDYITLTSATPANTPETIVKRDAQGNFAAGVITASLIGNVTGDVAGNLSGAASANVLKIGDTMTGQLRVSTGAVEPAVVITGQGAVAPALQLINNPASSASDTIVGIDAQGNITRSSILIGTLSAGTSGNVPNTLVFRDDLGDFVAGTITATGAFIGNLSGNVTGNVYGNVIGDLSGNVTGNVTGDVVGNVSGAASLNVLKSGDTMTGSLNMGGNNIINVNNATINNANIGNATITHGTVTTLDVLQTLTTKDLYVTGTQHIAFGVVDNLTILGTTDTKNLVVTDQATLNNLDVLGSATVTGSLTVNGLIYGTVQGGLVGYHTGNVHGNVLGDVTGNVFGNVIGNVVGNLSGNVTGNVYGNVIGNLSGNVTGNVTGDVVGNVLGDVTGAASLNVLKSGDTMTGSLNMGGNDITNVTNATITNANIGNATITHGTATTLDVLQTLTTKDLYVTGTQHIAFGVVDNLTVLGTTDTKNLVVTDQATLTNLDVLGSATVTGSLTANGLIYGTVQGGLVGYHTGNVHGNVLGDVTGNVFGNVIGNVVGNLSGNVTGNVYGNVIGDLSGNVTGNVTGDVVGNVSGAASLNVLKSGDTMTGSLNMGGNDITNVNNATINNANIGNATITHGTVTTLDVLQTLTVKDLYVTGTQHIAFGVVDNLTILGTTDTKNLVVTNQTTLNNLDVLGSGTVVGSLTVNGPIYGTVQGGLVGYHTGNVHGNVLGDVTGNVFGNVIGNVVGNLSGNVTGNVYGNVTGDLSGNVHGNVYGDVVGNVSGAASLNVLKSGDTMTGSLNMGGNDITNVNSATITNANIGNAVVTHGTVTTLDVLQTLTTKDLYVTGTQHIAFGVVDNLTVLGTTDTKNLVVTNQTTLNNLDVLGSATVTGNLTVNGPIYGTVQGGLVGYHTGNVHGNVLGDVTGNVFGNVIGNVVGNLSGNVTGNVYGNVTGDLSGNVYGDVIGNVSGAASLNVLKAGDTMTGTLRVTPSLIAAAAILRGQASTTAPALRLENNLVATNTDNLLAIDGAGNVSQTTVPVGLLGNATSGNVPNTLVLRNDTGSFEANVAYLQGLDVVRTSTFRDYIYNLFEAVSPNNVLYVHKGLVLAPNQFNSIKTAVDSVVGNGPTNPFVVVVSPGDYTEDTITMKQYVAILGSDENTTVIQPDTTTKNIIVGAGNTSLRNVKLTGAGTAGSGYAAISLSSGTMVVDRILFGSNDIHIKVRAPGAPSFMYLTNMRLTSTSAYTKAIDILGTTGAPCGVLLNNFACGAVTNGSTTVMTISGLGSFLFANYVTAGSYQGVPTAGTKFLTVSDGGIAEVFAGAINGFDTAFYVPSVGANAPRLSLSGIATENNNTDVWVQDQRTIGSITGEFAFAKINIDPAVTGLSLLLTEPTSGGITTVGNIRSGRSIGTITNISPMINYGTNLGVITGGELYSNPTSLVVTVSAGLGYLMETTAGVDNLKLVEWPTTQTGLIPNIDNYVYMDKNGLPNVALSDTSSIYTIPLGKARGSTTPTFGTLYLQEIQNDAAHTATKLVDALELSLGSIYVSGSIVTQNGATPSDTVNVTAGQYVFGEKIFEPVAGTAILMQDYLGSGTNLYLGTQSAVDWQQWDNGGSLVPIPANQYAKHLLFVIGGYDGDTDRVVQTFALVYSQTVFLSLNAAEVGPVPTKPISWTGNIVPIASIIVKNDALVKIAEILDERPRVGFVSSSVAGVTVHGNLLGLLADDHPQYVLTNGGRTMTGSLNMGTNNITNVGTVNGVTVQAHASRHLPNNITEDPLTVGVPSTIGTVNAEGGANAFARQDHIHAHGNQPGGSLHALVTTVTAGFMSNTDYIALTSATPANTPGTIVKRDAQGNFAAGIITASLVGNVTGDVAGNVLGNVTGNVVGNVFGNVTGASSLNVLKAGDTMTGQLRVSTSAAEPAVIITGQGTTASALQLVNNPTSSPSDTIVGIDAQGNITQSTILIGAIAGGTSGNVPNTLVFRDSLGNFTAGTITATGVFVGNLSGNVIGNVYGNVIGNLSGNVMGDVVGNVSGASSLNVLKAGDTMTGQLRISDAALSPLVATGNITSPAALLTGQSSTTAPALRLENNPTSQSTDMLLTIDSSGNVTKSTVALSGLGATGTSGNQPNTLVLRDTNSSFVAGIITATGGFIGNLTGNVQGNLVGYHTGNVSGNLFGNVTGNVFGNVIGNLSGNVTGNVVGNVSGSASANVLKIGDTMTGQLRISDVAAAALVATGNITSPAALLTGQSSTTAPALRLENNPTSQSSDVVLTIDSNGNVTKSSVVISGLGNSGTSGNVPNTLVLRDSNSSFVAGIITATGGFIGNLTGNVVGNVLGNVTGASSLNVLKAGDTMTGELRISDATLSPLVVTGNITSPAALLTGQNSTTAPALRLENNPTSQSNDVVLTIDSNGNVTKSSVAISGLGNSGTSGNVPNTLVLRDANSSFVAGIITATGGFIGNLTGNVQGNLVGYHTGNVSGNLFGNVTGNVFGNVQGNVTGASSLNVLKAGDTMTGELRISDATLSPLVVTGNITSPAALLTGQNSTTAPALRLENNPTSQSNDVVLTIDSNGNVTKSSVAISGLGNSGTSGNVPNTLVLRDANSSFVAGIITATGGFIGNLTGNVQGNLVGYHTGNVSGNLFGNVTGNVFGNVIGNLSGNVTGNVVGNVSGAASANVLKIGDTMTGQLRISDATVSPLVATGNITSPAALLTGQSSTTAPALRLANNPTSQSNDVVLTIDSNGNVTKSAVIIGGLGNSGTSGNVPNTLVLRDANSSFVAGIITATGGFIGNLTGNVQGNLVGYHTGNVSGNLFGNVTGNVFGNVIGNLSGNVTGNVVGNVSGAASANVLKIGDTMTGQLRISDATLSPLVLTGNATTPAATITGGQSTTTSGVLRLVNIPAIGTTDNVLAADVSGNVTKSSVVTVNSAGAVTHGAGTVALPSVTFSGNTNTGLYSPATNNVALTTNGSQRLLIDASGAVTINAPTANEIGLTVTGNTIGASGAAVINQGNNAASGSALIVNAALNAANNPAVVLNGAANAANIMTISGAASATGDGLVIDKSQAGASGEGLQVTGNTNNPAALLTGNSTTQAPALRLVGNPSLPIIPKLVVDTTGYALAFDTTGYVLTTDVTGNVMRSLGNNGDTFRTFFSQPNWYQPVDPRREVILYDDFMGASTASATGLPFGDTQWKSAINGGASTITGPTVANNAFGIAQLNIGNNAGGYAIIAKNILVDVAPLYFGLGKFVWETRVNFSSTATDYTFRIGLGGFTAPRTFPSNNDFSHGVYFEYTPATSLNWACKTASGNTRTSQDSGIVATAGTWHKLRIEVNEAGTAANFYIDNVLVTGVGFPITTNIPVTAGTACGPVIQLVRTSATVTRTLNVDYWYHQYVFTTPR